MAKATDYADILTAIRAGQPDKADTFHVAAWLHNLRWHHDRRMRGRQQLAREIVEQRLSEMAEAGWVARKGELWTPVAGGEC